LVEELDPTDLMDQAEQMEDRGRRSAVNAAVSAVAGGADVAAGHAVLVVVMAESGLVGDGAAIRKGSRLVVWQTPSFSRH
jgi:hypothetical protein